MKTSKKPVHRRGPRRETTRIAGRTFTKRCATMIERVAQEHRKSPTAVIVDVLEGWAKRRKRRGKARPPGSREGS